MMGRTRERERERATPERTPAGAAPWEAWRAVGDLLDGAGRRPRLLATVDGGIVGLVEHSEGVADDHLAWDDVELAALVESAPALRGQLRPPIYPTALAPTGYGDLLRTVALRACEEDWINVRLLFLPDRLWVAHGPRVARREDMLDGPAVCAALDDAYHRRRDPYTPTRMPTIERPLPCPTGPWVVAREEPYVRALARVGRTLDRERGAEPLVAETGDGLLVVALGADGRQRARLVDPAAPAARGWPHRAGPHEAALGALGLRLDGVGGHHALTVARPEGDWLLCSTVAREPRVASGNPLAHPRGRAA